MSWSRPCFDFWERYQIMRREQALRSSAVKESPSSSDEGLPALKAWAASRPSAPYICPRGRRSSSRTAHCPAGTGTGTHPHRSEEHTSELQSLMRISYAVFCLKKKKNPTLKLQQTQTTTP